MSQFSSASSPGGLETEPTWERRKSSFCCCHPRWCPLTSALVQTPWAPALISSAWHWPSPVSYICLLLWEPKCQTSADIAVFGDSVQWALLTFITCIFDQAWSKNNIFSKEIFKNLKFSRAFRSPVAAQKLSRPHMSQSLGSAECSLPLLWDNSVSPKAR
jgi:hypothetical protein